MLLIRSTNHSTKFCNTGKLNSLKEFLVEYNKVKWEFVDYLWNNRICWNNKILDIKNNKLDCPKFISTTNIPIDTDLSARAIKLTSGEALGIIKSQIEKRRKQFYILNKKQRDMDIISSAKIQSKIDSHPLIKPTKTKNILFANLDSLCCNFKEEINNKNFNGFLELTSLWKNQHRFKIHIPIKYTRNTNKFKNNNWELKTSWHVQLNQVSSRWEKEIPKSMGTKIVGADQGATTCISLSDKQVTGKNKAGYDLADIMKILARKQPGSNGYKKAQDHRVNYINWAIKQLNLDNIKELRLEYLYLLRNGNKTSKFLNRWTYTQINRAIYNACELHGVQVIEQAATYRSQRCSGCGWVQKTNRKRKEFICASCGFIEDADINGALNHEVDLYQLPFGFYQLKLNNTGFYWLSTGVFNINGQELIVPDVYKTN
jgi:transposase